jgi:acyl-coenzyme A thioesterase PaaI-like protein
VVSGPGTVGSATWASGAEHRHVVHELGLVVDRPAIEQLRGTAEIVPELWVPGSDVLRASVLAAWADVLTGLLAVDVVGPRVPVTLQLDLDLYAPPAGLSRIVGTARRLKVGSSVLVATVDFVGFGFGFGFVNGDGVGDGEERRLGRGTGTFMVSPDPGARMPEGLDPIALLATSGGPLEVPLAERIGLSRLPGGGAQFPRSDDALNASGTVNGGLLAVVAEEAVLAAVPGATVASLALRYLRPVRIGPAVATADVHGSLAEVTVRDAGRDDALALAATARVFT